MDLNNEGYEKLKNWEQDNMNWIHFASISINLDSVGEIRWNHCYCSKLITRVYFTQCDDYPTTDILEYEERKKLALAVGYHVENLQIN